MQKRGISKDEGNFFKLEIPLLMPQNINRVHACGISCWIQPATTPTRTEINTQGPKKHSIAISLKENVRGSLKAFSRR
jgi:hypothetical protein